MLNALDLQLVEGILRSRPNRFVFEGTVDGHRRRLHCPVTGSIGGVKNFDGIPCLITPGDGANPKRTTAGTVEAISLDGKKSWIGINQNRINGWMEQFLRTNAVPKIISCSGAEIFHEVRVGDSRLDLCVVSGGKKTFLEIKTPTHDFLLTPESHFTPPSSKEYFSRGIRHFQTLAQLALEGHRCLVLICFMYDAAEFNPPQQSSINSKVTEVVAWARSCGVENWQINLKITPSSLIIERYLRLSFGGHSDESDALSSNWKPKA
ncbi:MAG: DNA/RNA nuclease SfsA [Puniceicoccales bacterium]|jgi:sugar fermentation stimulation protein A|nr:DNA/RNA nuclease SfsA [Puniceicoccales bacterium]